MKSLQESLFDDDVLSKKLPIEKYMDDFSGDALEKLEPSERNSLFDQLFESGKICNVAELRKVPIDLTRNIIIQRRDRLKGLTERSYPCKYNFIYSLLFDGNPRTFIATLIDYRSGKCYYWTPSEFEIIDKKPTWKGKVSAFYTPGCTYSVISNEKWVKTIKYGILLN